MIVSPHQSKREIRQISRVSPFQITQFNSLGCEIGNWPIDCEGIAPSEEEIKAAMIEFVREVVLDLGDTFKIEVIDD